MRSSYLMKIYWHLKKTPKKKNWPMSNLPDFCQRITINRNSVVPFWPWKIYPFGRHRIVRVHRVCFRVSDSRRARPKVFIKMSTYAVAMVIICTRTDCGNVSRMKGLLHEIIGPRKRTHNIVLCVPTHSDFSLLQYLRLPADCISGGHCNPRFPSTTIHFVRGIDSVVSCRK